MPIGISGSRWGTNSAQWTELAQRLEDLFDLEDGIFLHGDCKGVDEEAHRIARRIGYHIEVYPPTDPKHRAYCDGDVIHPPRPYLERNELIVRAATRMLIVPEKAMKDSPRSGTWWTYRKAKELHVPTTLIVGGRFEHKPAPKQPAAPVDDDAVRLPPLKVESWRELPPTGGPGLPPDHLHRQGPGE